MLIVISEYEGIFSQMSVILFGEGEGGEEGKERDGKRSRE